MLDEWVASCEAYRAKTAETSKKYEFQMEVNRLMSVIVNPRHMDMQVFLRELVYNAANALEKAHFRSVQDDPCLSGAKDLEVSGTGRRDNS